MKKLFINYLALCSVILLLLSSCKKDETKAVATSGAAGTLSASSQTIVLDKTKYNVSDTSVMFNVTKANYGFNAAVTTVLQIDSMGDNWKNPQSISLAANATTETISTNDLNSLLLKLNLPSSVASQVQVRAMNSISSYVTNIYSNVITLTVTPFSLASYVYVPGAYQGWSPATADSLKSAAGNGIYTGVITFTTGNLDFKITPAKTWDVSYGSSGSGTVSTSGGNISAPAAGSYQIVVNLNTNTIVLTPTLWSIIGDGTPGGWGTDTDMKFNNGTQTWNITIALTANNLKFRLNHDWGTNYGGSGGILKSGGDNIAIPAAGTYLVTLDLNAVTYLLSKQ